MSNGTSWPSTVRARGLLTSTRRPPKVTEPFPLPWRTATRCGSCLPFGPVAAVTSASNIAAITAIPAATLIASSPSRATTAISASARLTSCGRPLTPTPWTCVTICTLLGTVFTAVPLIWSGRLGGRPTPTARQASGGGPPPQVPRRPGQPLIGSQTGSQAPQNWSSWAVGARPGWCWTQGIQRSNRWSERDAQPAQAPSDTRAVSGPVMTKPPPTT